MESENSEDLIVDVTSNEVQIALMENRRLIELNRSPASTTFPSEMYTRKGAEDSSRAQRCLRGHGGKKEGFVHYLTWGCISRRSTSSCARQPQLGSGACIPRSNSVPSGEGGTARGRVEGGPDDDRADRQGTDFHQGIQTDCGNFIGRTQHCTDALRREGEHLPENRLEGRKKKARDTGPEHSPQELRSHYPHGSRRQKRRGAGRGVEVSDREVGNFLEKESRNPKACNCSSPSTARPPQFSGIS